MMRFLYLYTCSALQVYIFCVYVYKCGAQRVGKTFVNSDAYRCKCIYIILYISRHKHKYFSNLYYKFKFVF